MIILLEARRKASALGLRTARAQIAALLARPEASPNCQKPKKEKAMELKEKLHNAACMKAGHRQVDVDGCCTTDGMRLLERRCTSTNAHSLAPMHTPFAPTCPMSRSTASKPCTASLQLHLRQAAAPRFWTCAHALSLPSI